MNFYKSILVVFLYLNASYSVYAIESFSIISQDSTTLNNSIVASTVADVLDLMQQSCNCRTTLNDTTASVQLLLPVIDNNTQNRPSRFAKVVDYPYSHYPDHDYFWTTSDELSDSSGLIFLLETPSYQGISCGLYGLLQEQLGFAFYHPKESIIPNIEDWPIPSNFTWKAKARFDKKGFHLHTQHPLELTEALLDVNYPDALSEVKQYIDWLARNQQNYFEFCLLESIDRKKWPAHAKAFVDYAHQRGILASVDLSLHMIQQKTFQLYKSFPKSLKSKRKQIEKNLEWLFAADWDYLNVEFDMAEFIGGNVKKREQLRLFLGELIDEKYGAKLMGREHVVKSENEVGNAEKLVMTEAEKVVDAKRGLLVHTVMCYSLKEPNAPVYQNENLNHMYDMLLEEKEQRETWYYPESAYWVTFDNSLPIMLLPYLSSRLEDIETTAKEGISGHITFSSGWEWSYWLVDWSIARWSWAHTVNGVDLKNTPCEYVKSAFGTDSVRLFAEKSLSIQQNYLKDKALMKYMTAMTATDELPKFANRQFHPRPEPSYKEMRRSADLDELHDIKAEGVQQLLEFSLAQQKLIQENQTFFKKNKEQVSDNQRKILDEFIESLKITALRAEHRAHTLCYLLGERENTLTDGETDNLHYLERAVAIREAAQFLVNQREKAYRYPLETIARKRWGHTAYHFGYLYPVSNLHFWFREEEQARNNRFGVFYHNIWNIWRIIGVID